MIAWSADADIRISRGLPRTPSVKAVVLISLEKIDVLTQRRFVCSDHIVKTRKGGMTRAVDYWER